MNDLRELGLITIKRQPINPQDFDLERIRNAYTLQLDTLDQTAHRTPSDLPADLAFGEDNVSDS